MLAGIVGLFVLCCLFCESCSWSSVKQVRKATVFKTCDSCQGNITGTGIGMCFGNMWIANCAACPDGVVDMNRLWSVRGSDLHYESYLRASNNWWRVKVMVPGCHETWLVSLKNILKLCYIGFQKYIEVSHLYIISKNYTLIYREHFALRSRQDVTFHYQKQQEQGNQQQQQQPTQHPVKARSRGLRKQQRTESRLPLLESGDEPQPGPSGEQNPVLKRGSSSEAEAESSGDDSVKFENNFKKTIPFSGHCKNKSLPEPSAGYKSRPRPSGKGSRFPMLKHQTRSVPGVSVLRHG